jgi:hypothetical protein
MSQVLGWPIHPCPCAASTRLAAWMERHCPGSLETTEPFCKLQSGVLLERLEEIGELKTALEAKGCERSSGSG